MKTLFTIIFLTIFGLNNINSATFSSVSSGTWSAPATWNITGADADGIPDSDDDVTINVGHSISLSSGGSVRNFTNNGSLNGNSEILSVYGDYTNTGSFPTKHILAIRGACVFTSSNQFNGALSWYILANLTISSGTSIFCSGSFNVNSGYFATNFGTVSINSNLALTGSGKFVNGVNSSLSIGANITGTGGLIASATNNTVSYRNNSNIFTKSATYYNLIILAATPTRTATGNITVLNNFTLGAGTNNVLDLANFNLTVGGNWSNLGSNTIINQGIITFNGSGVQTLSRTSGNEVITNFIKSGVGTLALNKAVTINQNLTINGGILDVSASSFSIDIKGNFSNNASIDTRQGFINFSGSVAQTISGTSATTFYNLNSSNVAGVSITSASTISNILTVSVGSFGTSGAGTIKIPATGATNYGRIGMVGGSLIGNGWTIESFIQGPAPKGWQWLSSPINGNTLADWDNDARFYMSGVGGNDGNSAGFKSVRKYNEVTGAYVNITTTSELLNAGKGIMVWMADNNTTGLTAPLIYNSVGTPNFDNKSIAITSGGAGSGYNLVGNPYACPINYSAVVAATGNIDPSFVILLENGTYSTDPNGGIIAPNQGFMCIANSAGSINFTEACKNTGSLPNILRTAPKNNSVIFNVYNDINGLGGQTTIEFSENAADVFEQNKDLSFLASPYDDADNIWTNTSDNKSMLRNALYANDTEKNVPLTVKSGVYGMHTISVKGLGSLTSYNSVIIEDLTTGKKIDLVKEQNYSFNAQEIGKEYNFVVYFSKNNLSDSPKSLITSNTLNENTSVYNTPSNVVIKFDMPEETPVTISVYNLTGQQVITTMNLNVVSDRIALPLQKENGMYLLIIQSKNQKISRKIIF